MDTIGLKKIKSILIKHPEAYITKPQSLFDSEDSKRYQLLLVKKNAFIKFHEYMFSLSNEALELLHSDYKKQQADYFKKDNTVNHLDMFLLKDAIQYHVTLRFETNLDIDLIIGIATSWRDNIKQSNEFENLNSEHLIMLAESLKKH